MFAAFAEDEEATVRLMIIFQKHGIVRVRRLILETRAFIKEG